MDNQIIKRLDEVSPDRIFSRKENTGTYYSFNNSVFFISNDRKVQQSATILEQFQSNNLITQKLFQLIDPESLAPHILSFIGYGLSSSGNSLESSESTVTISKASSLEPTEIPTESKWQGSSYFPKFAKDAKTKTHLYLRSDLLHALRTYSQSRQETMTTVFNDLLAESFGDLALQLQKGI